MKGWMLSILKDCLNVTKWLVLAAIPTVLMVSHVWTQYQETRLGYQISEETSRHKKLSEEHRRLTIEKRVQAQGGQMTTRAGDRFGLQRVTPEQLITVEPVAERAFADNAKGRQRARQ